MYNQGWKQPDKTHYWGWSLIIVPVIMALIQC